MPGSWHVGSKQWGKTVEHLSRIWSQLFILDSCLQRKVTVNRRYYESHWSFKQLLHSTRYFFECGNSILWIIYTNCIFKNFYSLVQGRPFEVKEMFLEDILRTTGYTNKEMLKYKKEKQRGRIFVFFFKEFTTENYFYNFYIISLPYTS